MLCAVSRFNQMLIIFVVIFLPAFLGHRSAIRESHSKREELIATFIIWGMATAIALGLLFGLGPSLGWEYDR